MAAGIALHGPRLLNHDVAWFAWAARAWLGGKVLGTDLTDPNMPLATLLYVPAAWAAPLVGLSLAVKAWLLSVAALSIALAWPDVEWERRTGFFVALVLFLLLGWPREFAQREQFAMLLVLPYVLPAKRRGSRAVLVGTAAGIGFALKPYFLIPWILIEIGRRPFRTEQLALMAVGAAYAFSLLTVFQTFTFDLLPATLASYGAFNRPAAMSAMAMPVALGVLAFSISRRAHDKLGEALSVGSLGFALAAAVQTKFYDYHLVPAWGFAVLAFASYLRGKELLNRLAATIMLILAAISLTDPMINWLREDSRKAAELGNIMREIDGACSFAVVSVHPYPAFPLVLRAEGEGKAHFVGSASSHWFLPAAFKGNGNAILRARTQFRKDLERSPDVVILDKNWQRHTDSPPRIDGLRFLTDDPSVNMLWTDYRPTGEVGSYSIYRRKAGSTCQMGSGAVNPAARHFRALPETFNSR